jgi:hypothetical protein
MKNLIFRQLLLLLLISSLFSIYSCSKEEEKVYPTAATPLNIFPANNDTGIIRFPILTWSACKYMNNDTVSYDVYLGLTNPPDLVASNIMSNQFMSVNLLLPYQKYYWKVVSKDMNAHATSSDIWSFTTGNSYGTGRGDLAVMVTDTSHSGFFGGVTVFLYLTEADRANDPHFYNYYRRATTDCFDAENIGAVFYALTTQKYFVFCRLDRGGGNYLEGLGESFVIPGKSTKLLVELK